MSVPVQGVNNGVRLTTFKPPGLTMLNQARLIRLNSVERAQENTKKGESGGSNITSFSDGTLCLGVRIITTPHNHYQTCIPVRGTTE
jgi:hypothetical protein